MIKIGVLGASGKMGQRLITLLEQDPGAKALYAIPRNPSYVFQEADVVVDFSAAAALSEHLKCALSCPKPFLVGVTGVTDSHKEAMEQAAQKMPLLYTPNTSFGISLLEKLVYQAAELLDDSFDVELFESHHRHKADAPSGTALLLGGAVARGRNVSFKDVAVLGRTPHSPKRQRGEIGFSIQRGGSQGFEHTVHFIGDEEEIVLSHKGLSRDLFVKGAIRAAKWLVTQPLGFYTQAQVE